MSEFIMKDSTMTDVVTTNPKLRSKAEFKATRAKLHAEAAALRWDVVLREEWCDFKNHDLEPMQLPADNVIITMEKNFDRCFNKEECIKRLHEMNEYFLKEKMCPYMPYNFVVGNDRNVYEARGWRRKPFKAEEYPEFYDKTVDIAVLGLNGRVQAKLTGYDEALEIAKLFIKAGVKHKMIDEDYYLRAFDGERKLF